MLEYHKLPSAQYHQAGCGWFDGLLSSVDVPLYSAMLATFEYDGYT